MLVVLFWIFTFLACASILAFIIALFIKNKNFRKIVFCVFIISIIGLILTLKSCFGKVKNDFGYKERTKNDSIREQENSIKTKQVITQFDSIEHVFDSIKKQQIQNGK